MIQNALRFTVAAFVFAVAGSAHANIQISTNTFDLASSDEADMVNTNTLSGYLIHSDNHSSSFLFNSYSEALNFPLADYGNGNLHSASFILDVRPGYQITGVKFSGMLSGELQTTPIPRGENYSGQEGVAVNDMRTWMNVGTTLYGNDIGTKYVQYDNTNGTRDFSIGMYGLSLTGQKHLEVMTVAGTGAQASFWTFASREVYVSGGDASYASMNVLNPTLTIYTAPVPEPETYAMLLAGLMGVGAIARRRRAACADKA